MVRDGVPGAGGRTGAVAGVILGLLVGAIFGCGGRDPAAPDGQAPGDIAGPTDTADPPPSPERPPRGQEAIEAWLAEGHYRQWVCETGLSAPRLGGNHGWHRICWNALLAGSPSGPYPVGAAAVKERFTVDGIANGVAVSLKVATDEGPHTWYWYERGGEHPPLRPAVEGVGVPDCTVCHGMALRDFVYIPPGR